MERVGDWRSQTRALVDEKILTVCREVNDDGGMGGRGYLLQSELQKGGRCYWLELRSQWLHATEPRNNLQKAVTQL